MEVLTGNNNEQKKKKTSSGSANIEKCFPDIISAMALSAEEELNSFTSWLLIETLRRRAACALRLVKREGWELIRNELLHWHVGGGVM